MCYTGLCKFENYIGDCVYNTVTTEDQRKLYTALNVNECFVGGLTWSILNNRQNTTYEDALLDALTTATAADAPTVLIDLRGP